MKKRKKLHLLGLTMKMLNDKFYLIIKQIMSHQNLQSQIVESWIQAWFVHRHSQALSMVVNRLVHHRLLRYRHPLKCLKSLREKRETWALQISFRSSMIAIKSQNHRSHLSQKSRHLRQSKRKHLKRYKRKKKKAKLLKLYKVRLKKRKLERRIKCSRWSSIDISIRSREKDRL